MYEKLETIGRGSFSLVCKVRRLSDGRILAQKEIDYGQMTKFEKQQLVTEVNILQELKHPNIVAYYERIIDISASKIYIITEHCEGGDLAALISKNRMQSIYFNEDIAWSILTQLALALHECHYGSDQTNHATILHRDIKPENVFLDKNMNAKLGDFGLCKVVESSVSVFAKTFVGTPFYMSPELIGSNGYNTKSDIWALGCVIYELMALQPPFQAKTPKELSKRIQQGNPPDLPNSFSLELKNIVRAMLNLDPAKRPDTKQLLAHKRISLIAKERELLRFHSELIIKENELKQISEGLIKERLLLNEKRKQLDAQEKKIYSAQNHLSNNPDPNLLAFNGGPLSPSQLRKILHTKSYSLLQQKKTY